MSFLPLAGVGTRYRVRDPSYLVGAYGARVHSAWLEGDYPHQAGHVEVNVNLENGVNIRLIYEAATGECCGLPGLDIVGLWAGQGYWPYTPVDLPTDGGPAEPAVAPTHSCWVSGHVAADTGFKRSWCKHCNTTLVFDNWEWKEEPC